MTTLLQEYIDTQSKLKRLQVESSNLLDEITDIRGYSCNGEYVTYSSEPREFIDIVVKINSEILAYDILGLNKQHLVDTRENITNLFKLISKKRKIHTQVLLLQEFLEKLYKLLNNEEKAKLLPRPEDIEF